MSKTSAGTLSTYSGSSTALTSDFDLSECEGLNRDSKIKEKNKDSNNGSFSSSTFNSSSSSSSGASLAIAYAASSFLEHQISVETPIHKSPYVVAEEKQDQRSAEQQKQETRQPIARPEQSIPTSQQQQRTPRVTKASIPFQKTIPPTSFLRDELAKDPAYMHALRAGTLWQSLIGQHVKLPILWYDGEEPARPYMGCEDSLKRNNWSFFGRHRVAGDLKLNAFVKQRNSSGKLLLHIVGKDSETMKPTEDIVVGVFHPGAEGIIGNKSNASKSKPECHNRYEDCRDVWIGHRSRSIPHNGRRIATRIESLLRYLNKNRVDKSPLGRGCNGNSSSSDSNTNNRRSVIIDNTNMNSIFGRRPPKHTIFVSEQELYSLLTMPLFPNVPSSSPPASVLLLRAFLQ